jgi:hypothetical protein
VTAEDAPVTNAIIFLISDLIFSLSIQNKHICTLIRLYSGDSGGLSQRDLNGTYPRWTVIMESILG